ncbi:MAG: hypothetical protein FWF84_04775 [Kiritimatiellaeota bacterium]|nr:hypothetical protein [Kiritimatiellota bacterium]
MSTQELFLAIDHGGTKCDCVIMRRDGTIHSWGHFSYPGRSGRSAYAINEAVSQALTSGHITEEDVFTLCFLGGYASNSIEGRFRKGTRAEAAKTHSHVDAKVRDFFAECFDGTVGFLARVDHYFAVNEHRAALAMCGFEDGIVALAGTGAFINITLAERQKWLHIDGLGPVAGDHGGAYQVGLAAFRAAVVADWGSARRRTTLRDAVFRALKVGNAHDASQFSLYWHDRSVMASLAKVVSHEAEQGDAMARRILEEAADDLCATLQDALELTGLTGEALPLIGTGSMLVKSPVYWDRFCERVHDFAPRLEFHRNQRPSVLGVVLRGMTRKDELSVEDWRKLLTDINAGYDNFIKAKDKQ